MNLNCAGGISIRFILHDKYKTEKTLHIQLDRFCQNAKIEMKIKEKKSRVESTETEKSHI